MSPTNYASVSGRLPRLIFSPTAALKTRFVEVTARSSGPLNHDAPQ